MNDYTRVLKNPPGILLNLNEANFHLNPLLAKLTCQMASSPNVKFSLFASNDTSTFSNNNAKSSNCGSISPYHPLPVHIYSIAEL